MDIIAFKKLILQREGEKQRIFSNAIANKACVPSNERQFGEWDLFDTLDEYNEYLRLSVTTKEELKKIQQANHLYLLELLEKMTQDDWKQKINHPLFDKTLKEFIEWGFWHFDHHSLVFSTF